MLPPDSLPIPGIRRVPYLVLVAACLLLAVLGGRGCAAHVDWSMADH